MLYPGLRPNPLLDSHQRRGASMHRTRLLVLLSVFLALAGLFQAQGIMLCLVLQSQHAVILQRIGLTDITVNYHRPLVSNRQIWGEVVPDGSLCRPGAIENTTDAITDRLTIEGQPRDDGAYGLHMIATEN